ncbi:MAG: hypothetical protein HQK96_04340 [Nitrospirae bacterium]|nr:hypothetical protein [Nitrospirota bacterium]
MSSGGIGTTHYQNTINDNRMTDLQNSTTPPLAYSECYALAYLTDIPQDVEKYGFCKTLAVRREVIHIKHIFTEVFVRKTIDIQKYLDEIGWSLFDYMKYMTNRLRKVHYFSREYINNINEIVKADRDRFFFPTIQLYNGLNCVIALDFDGVVTESSFYELYKLCIDRCKTEICSANPEIKSSWFEVRNLALPNKINSCKGKIKKISKLIELNQKNDCVFYIDNEKEYLEFAWLFGIQTYIYENKQIKYFSLKSK